MDFDAAQLRHVLDSTGVAILATDVDERIIYWSSAAADLFGCSAADAHGRSFTELVIPPGCHAAIPDARTTIASGTSWTGELPVRCRDGALLTVQMRRAPIHDDAGRPVAVATVLVDVTDRVQDDPKLRREEELLRSTIDRAPIVLFATDAAGIFTVSRGRGLAALGLHDDEVLGRSALDIYGTLTVTVGAERMSFAAAFRRAVDGASIEAHTSVGVAHFDLWLTPVRDSADRVTGLVGVALDVTRRSELEQRLQQAEKLEALGLLAGGVAHDFNNMLTAILGHAEILALDIRDDRLREDVESIQHAAESAAATTKQLLAFTRRQHQELRPIDINQIVRSIEGLIRRTVGEQIAVVLHLTDEAAAIVADTTQMEQAILNLAINARDAMPGGGRLTITTAIVGLNGECVEISVADTGHGIDSAIRERIFEPFFTTKERGRGTGLGLASVHGIVTQTGGDISVESAPGGTVFRIVFPRAQSPGFTAIGQDQQVANESREKGRARILVAEDEKTVLELIETILTRAGYSVAAHETPEAALDDLRAHPDAYDLLLSDVMMPGMTGSQLAAEAGRICPALPVVFMSGYTDRAASPHPDLAKPFTREQLLACIQRSLG